MDDYEKVANWIIEECDNPQEEVAWLLFMLDEGSEAIKGNRKKTFKEAYKFLLRRIEDE
jgi:hypothetical protein